MRGFRLFQERPGMTDSQRPQQRLNQAAEAVRTFSCGTASDVDLTPPPAAHDRRQQVHAAETRLLYENATTGIVASVLIALALGYTQRDVTATPIVDAWLLFVLVVAAARFAITRLYWRASPSEVESRRWNNMFVAGTALASAAWGVAGVLFYEPSQPTNGIFLMFVLGGVMLGGASLLAARPEAFFMFFLPIGLLTAIRLAGEGGQEHLTMAFLVVVFTVATIATTWRFHMAISSSLRLRFDNLDLIESLRTAKDHTEALNRDLELRVRDRTAMLIEADQRKDEFLATLAHELRNPLAPIRFALETLKGNAQPAAAGRAREVIDRQVRQLVRLVDDLLDVSRITTNKMVLRRETHDLGRLMATAVESIMPLATAADHTLTLEPPETQTSVDGDGARLVQVFANALNNAVKFTPRGGRIRFTAERQSSEAVVRIRDTGMGISADVLPRVFDMFHQAEPILERSAGGLGIGLTLARRLIEMHDGRIEIRSPGPGKGTEVEIRLPTTEAMVVRGTEAERRPAAAARSLRVLIVEDNLDAAEMLDVAVSQLGHATRLAHDGASAITFAGQFVPDVILLDIGLPVMNGYAVAQALRARPEFDHIHIAALTGWGQDEDRRKAREAGFDSHFTKPLAPSAMEDLLARIAQGTAPQRDPSSTPRTRITDSGSSV
jgi:signal transduction histidine kinase/ActR/RegA family two-component response regulator